MRACSVSEQDSHIPLDRRTFLRWLSRWWRGQYESVSPSFSITPSRGPVCRLAAAALDVAAGRVYASWSLQPDSTARPRRCTQVHCPARLPPISGRYPTVPAGAHKFWRRHAVEEGNRVVGFFQHKHVPRPAVSHSRTPIDTSRDQYLSKSKSARISWLQPPG